MVQKKVEVNGCEFVELTTEVGVSHICKIANVGKNEYYVYGDRGEGFCIATLNTEELVELITTNEVNLSGTIIKPYIEVTSVSALYIAFACDEWRSFSSFRLIGVFDQAGLKKHVDSDYKNYEYNGKKIELEDLNSITVEDILEQQIEYLHVEQAEINEVLI